MSFSVDVSSMKERTVSELLANGWSKNDMTHKDIIIKRISELGVPYNNYSIEFLSIFWKLKIDKYVRRGLFKTEVRELGHVMLFDIDCIITNLFPKYEFDVNDEILDFIDSISKRLGINLAFIGVSYEKQFSTSRILKCIFVTDVGQIIKFCEDDQVFIFGDNFLSATENLILHSNYKVDMISQLWKLRPKDRKGDFPDCWFD